MAHFLFYFIFFLEQRELSEARQLREMKGVIFGTILTTLGSECLQTDIPHSGCSPLM